MNFIVYGKDDCPFCTATKDLLNDANYSYTYYTLNVDYDRNELAAYMEAEGLSTEKITVPQIWLEVVNTTIYIGGFTELEKYFEKK